MITIGSIFSGPELRGGIFDKALTAAGTAATEICGKASSFTRPSVNVVFCVPGSLGAPDWDHGRIARYSKKRKLLLVQVAVPKKDVYSDKALERIIDELHGTTATAILFFKEKGLDFSLEEATALVDKIGQRAAEILAHK